MTTEVDKSIVVDVPVSTAYNQWTQFEDFPQFMGGVQQVTQTTDRRLHWVAEIGGVKREWDAEVLEQVPDQKVAWAATEGSTNAGAVYFEPVGASQTSVRLHLEYEPEGLVEQAGDRLGIIERQAESDLERFKQFIESRGSETGSWRGTVDEGAVGTPGVEHAEESRGDSGKAGLSGKAVAAGAAAVAAAGLAAAAATRSSSDTENETDTEVVAPAPVSDVDVVPDAPVYGTDAGVVDTAGVEPVVGTTDLDAGAADDAPGTGDYPPPVR